MPKHVTTGSLMFNVLDYGAKGDYNSTTGVGTDDTAAFQAALNDAHGALWGVVYVPPTKKFRIAGTLTIDARTTTLFGYRATLYYTGTGLMFQVKGGGTISNQGGICLQGLRLLGPGKTSTAVAIQFNTDDALTTLSYVAGHPFENLEITDFGVGLKQANRAWGNTLRSSSILRCGAGLLVPTGLTSSQGERLAFDDCIIAENTVGIDIQGPHVDLVLNNCSLDYNSVAYKSNNHVVMNGGHVEVNGAGAAGSLWAGPYGHIQHTASTARSMFFGVRFVIGQMHTEFFEPYNGGDDITDELSLDAFLGWGCTFSWGAVNMWGAFVSRTPGFPYKRLVNEANGRRGTRRGIFRNIGITDDSNGRRPYFGASLVPSRTATVALPTAAVSVSGGTAVVRGDTLADQTGANPVSAITLSAPADAAGTNSLNVNIRIYVGPDDAGKMFFADALADLTVTGADSQRVCYINFNAQNDVSLMAAETGMNLTTMAAGTTTGVSLIPTYSQMKVPVGTHYINIQLQFTKIRNGDVFKIYHPQVNIV